MNKEVKITDFRAIIVTSCWLSIAIISSVYMWLFADKLSDILFGVFLPIGALVFVAFIVTMIVLSKSEAAQNHSN